MALLHVEIKLVTKYQALQQTKQLEDTMLSENSKVFVSSLRISLNAERTSRKQNNDCFRLVKSI